MSFGTVLLSIPWSTKGKTQESFDKFKAGLEHTISTKSGNVRKKSRICPFETFSRLFGALGPEAPKRPFSDF